MVTEAVAAHQGATVNEVADELGIDQSGASRFLAQAVERGYLRKVTSPTDARQRRLLVTNKGAKMLDSAHQWQEIRLRRAHRRPVGRRDDVQRFHGYLQRFLAVQQERP